MGAAAGAELDRPETYLSAVMRAWLQAGPDYPACRQVSRVRMLIAGSAGMLRPRPDSTRERVLPVPRIAGAASDAAGQARR
jgi:hypothetical protein